MKRCNKCLIFKGYSFFYKDKSRKDNISDTCKICSKKRSSLWAKENKHRINERNSNWQKNNKHRVYEYNLKSDYGMEYGVYDKLYDQQNGKCLICDGHYPKRKLVVDHSHQSKRIRGLLCMSCNKGIGLLKDNPTLLHRAGDYLLESTYPCKPDIFEKTYEPA